MNGRIMTLGPPASILPKAPYYFPLGSLLPTGPQPVLLTAEDCYDSIICYKLLRWQLKATGGNIACE
jgi:hypothetical protein